MHFRVALATLLLTAGILRADLITLENGDTVKGEILSQTKDTITLKTPYGNLTWNKSRIRIIRYEGRPAEGPVANIYTADRLILRGQLLRQDTGSLTIRTLDGQEKSIPMATISRVDWQVKPTLVFTIGEDLRLSSLWRSAVYPGWGQFHQKRQAMGYTLAFGFGTLTLGSLVARLRYEDLLGDYQALGYDDRDLRRCTDAWRTAWNVGIVSLLAVYFYNLADSLLFAPRQQIIKYRLALAPEISPERLACGIALRF